MLNMSAAKSHSKKAHNDKNSFVHRVSLLVKTLILRSYLDFNCPFSNLGYKKDTFKLQNFYILILFLKKNKKNNMIDL